MRKHQIFGAMIAILFASPSFAAQWNSLSIEQQRALERMRHRARNNRSDASDRVQRRAKDHRPQAKNPPRDGRPRQ
jgi:hypothetical protein